ncbi:translation initiation factor IF-2 [archaeon]|nr:translation initiation factor IF-2 [archaeon]
MPLRQPLVCVLGHIDHGKTTLLDQIRGTTVAVREPGRITQHIGASFVPSDVIVQLCRRVLGPSFSTAFKLPGLLFIDTPGHAIFYNLRKRGGSVADIAILVIDIMQGIQEQTIEAIEILRERRTPFLVAATKIDLIPGWRPHPDLPISKSLEKQSADARTQFLQRIYAIVEGLNRFGFNADLYYSITDFTRTVAVVPVSGKTGEGVAELLAVTMGLAQRYLTDQLRVSEGPGKAVVLEVSEEEGLGETARIVLYDGVLRKNDRIVTLSKEGPVTTTIKAILMPTGMGDIRDRRTRFSFVNSISAAAGAKIVFSDRINVLPGAELFVAPDPQTEEQIRKQLLGQLREMIFETDRIGVVVKADTLGSLEAMIAYARRVEIPVRKADVGPVSKRDVVEAHAVSRKEPELGAILAFQTRVLEEAQEEAVRLIVRIFSGDVLYRIFEDYLEWREQVRSKKVSEIDLMVRPGKVRVIPGCVFRRSKPPIFGVEVLAGKIKPGYSFIRPDGVELKAPIKSIQKHGKSIPEAVKGDQVAISLDSDRIMIGRHIKEGDTLLVSVPEPHAFAWLRRYSEALEPDEKEVLLELVRIKREKDPLWAR